MSAKKTTLPVVSPTLIKQVEAIGPFMDSVRPLSETIRKWGLSESKYLYQLADIAEKLAPIAERAIAAEEEANRVIELMGEATISVFFNSPHISPMAFLRILEILKEKEAVSIDTQVAAMFEREKSEQGRMRAEALHSRPGGSREKRDKIREIWASGKYSSKNICAEQECAGLNMSFKTARNALNGEPNPKKE